jgi:flavin-dependent thymidylate synthase
MEDDRRKKIGKTIKVLDHGYVRLVDFMGSDERIVEAARISYNSPSKGEAQDKKLLRYLYRNKHCYHPDMEVLTIDGWKKWKDCNEFEEFLIPDPKSKKLIREKLKLLTFEVLDEEMECFENQRMSYCVTPDHKMWFRSINSFRLGKFDDFKLIPANQLASYGHFECGSNYSEYEDVPNDLFYSLIGFYLGDGFLRSKNIVSFRLVKDRKIKYLENLLTSLKIEFSKDPSGVTSNNNDIFQFCFRASELRGSIDLSLKTHEKQFDLSKIKNLSPEERAGLLDGLINSDGSIKKDRNQIEFSSTSENLVKLVELLASLRKIDAHRKKNGRGEVSYTILYPSKNRTSLETRKEYFFAKKYTGKVYCATSSTGLLIVRGGQDKFSFVSGNSSPFEQVKIALNIKMPIFIMRQYVRHRMQNLNEVSARYTQLPNEFYIPSNWRRQDLKNKQGSVIGEDFNPDVNVIVIEGCSEKTIPATKALTDHCYRSYDLYEEMIKSGIAREMARMVLPVNIYTEIYTTWDLKNLLHFIALRDDSHAQAEIQEYGKAIKEICKDIFPWTMEVYEEIQSNKS